MKHEHHHVATSCLSPATSILNGLQLCLGWTTGWRVPMHVRHQCSSSGIRIEERAYTPLGCKDKGETTCLRNCSEVYFWTTSTVLCITFPILHLLCLVVSTVT